MQAVKQVSKTQQQAVQHCSAERCGCLAAWVHVWCGVAKTFARQLDAKQKIHRGALVE